MNSPSKQEAAQFALMLASGAPAMEAIRYFLPADSEERLAAPAVEALASRWLADKGVQAEIVALQGKEWEGMTTEEKLRFSVDKTYVEMAYFLYSRNYVELSGPERAKADTCRTTLEAKLAGVAGKMSAVEQFWSDISSGKIKLSQQVSPSITRVADPSSVGAAPEGRSPRGQAHAVEGN